MEKRSEDFAFLSVGVVDEKLLYEQTRSE